MNALKSVDLVLFSKIFSISGNSRYEVFVDPKDSLNVNILDRAKNAVFYEGKPVDEIVAATDEFEKKHNRYPILFIYGVGNGLFLKLLLKNQNHFRIYVIEPELELLYIALNLLDFSEDIKNRRIVFLDGKDVSFSTGVEIFSDKDIKVFCKTYHLEPNISYYDSFFTDNILETNAAFIRAITHVVTGLGNDSTDALIGLEWHLANVEKMITTPTLHELVRKAKSSETAIIISTGPSLIKQLPLLKKIKEHVTLLSVDASLPILEKHGIKPDIVLSIERVALTAEFYKQTSEEFKKGIICAISSLAHPALVEAVGSGTLQINMRPLGYTRYFDLSEYGYMGLGMSSANLAYELAYLAKFKNIILIGQDLAYGESGESHSKGHRVGNFKVKKSDPTVTAWGGNGEVKTTLFWNMFRNFFEHDIHFANQEGYVTVDATEGGARIEGALELSFKEAVKKYVDKEFKKEKIVLEMPTKDEVKKNEAHVKKKIEFLESFTKKTQKKVSKLFEDVSKTIKKLDKQNVRKNLSKVNYDELAALMKRIDEVKAPFDDKEFADMFIDATQAVMVHEELEIARVQVRPINSEDDKRLKMIDWIYAHQRWLFSLAGLLEAQSVAVERRGGQKEFVHKVKLAEDWSGFSGYFYDYTDKKQDFIIELLADGEVVHSKEHVVKRESDRKFTINFPSRFYDGKKRQFMVREKNSGIILWGGLADVVLLEEDKNKAKFLESIEHANYDELRDLYKPNSIGFLATKENLEDTDFMNYVKGIKNRFSDAKFVGFCFTKPSDDFAEYIKISDIKDIINNSCIFIVNPQLQDNNLDQYISNNQEKFINVFINPHNKTNINKYIKDIQNQKLIKIIKSNLELLKLTQEDIKDISDNHILMIIKSIEKLTEVEILDKNKLLNSGLRELLELYIKESLNNKKFIETLNYITSILIGKLK